MKAKNKANKKANNKYDIYQRSLHWIMAVIIISLLGVGWYMAGLDDKDPIRSDLYNLHKSFGALVLLLISLRIFARLTGKVPALPKGFSKLSKQMAHGAHYILYVLMVAVPLFGYAMSNSYGYPVKFFNLSLPNLFPKDKEFADISKELHEILAYTLLAIVVLHFAGVIKHRFFDKKGNDVLKRML